MAMMRCARNGFNHLHTLYHTFSTNATSVAVSVKTIAPPVFFIRIFHLFRVLPSFLFATAIKCSLDQLLLLVALPAVIEGEES